MQAGPIILGGRDLAVTLAAVLPSWLADSFARQLAATSATLGMVIDLFCALSEALKLVVEGSVRDGGFLQAFPDPACPASPQLRMSPC